MIVNAQAAVDRYSVLIAKEGFVPAECENIVWAQSLIDNGAKTFESLMNEVEKSAMSGGGTHHLIFQTCRLLWPEMSDDQRLHVLSIIDRFGSIKTVLHRKAFPHQIEGVAKAFVVDCLNRSGSNLTARALDG